MQIMIDTANERRHTLLIAAAALTLLAEAEAQPAAVEDAVAGLVFKTTVGAAPKPIKTPTPPPIGQPAPAAPVIPLPADNTPPAPVEHPDVHHDADRFIPSPPPENVPAGTQDALPPAAVFGGALPLGGTQDVSGGYLAPGSVPPVPTAALPVTMTQGAGTADAPFVPAPPVAAAPNVVSAPTVTDSAAAPVAGAAPANGELDKDGLPWDARIHSETKKKNQDGTWRFRRNLDDAIKKAVLAELMAARGGAAPATFQSPAGIASAVPVPPAAPAVPVPPAPTATVPVPPVPAAGSVPVQPAPVTNNTVVPFPGQAPAAPSVPVPPASNVGVPNSGLPVVVSSFRELIQLVNVSLAKGAMTQAQLTEACGHVKVESITGLASQPALVPDIYKYMRERNWLIAA